MGRGDGLADGGSERVRHRARGAVEPDLPGSRRLLRDDRGERGRGTVDAEAVAANVLDRARVAGEREVGVPDDQRRFHRLVLGEDERLREDAADERVEATEPKLGVRREHDAHGEPGRREVAADAGPAACVLRGDTP